MILKSVNINKGSLTMHIVNFSIKDTASFGKAPVSAICVIDNSVDQNHGLFKVFNEVDQNNS